jgi:hypothetical protein
MELMEKLPQIQEKYFFRLPYAHIIADYVWPGVIMSPKRVIDIRDLEFGPQDVVIASYPKSGTTWISELASALAYNGNTEEVKHVRQDVRVPWLELENDYWWVRVFHWWSRLTGSDLKEKKKEPNQLLAGTQFRLCFTHLPVELLPKSVLEGKCKVLYVSRNPKDNAVSFFHFHRMARFLGLQKNLDWNEFFPLYLSGSLYCGSWFEHVLGYWQFAQNNKNVMFCKYEDMKENLETEISKIASFLEIELSDEQRQRVVKHCTFETMKDNKMANRDAIWLFNQKISKFMRKGQVGDWKNYFTLAQSAAFDEIYAEKMAGSGLDFKFE